MEEIELKLIAGASFDASSLEAKLSTAGKLVRTESFEQQDTYLDTPTAELVALGLSARVRAKGSGQSVDVKPVPIEASLVMRRSELQAPVTKKGTPGRTLRKLLARMLGVALEGQPAPVARLFTQRVVHNMSIGDSRVEVCFDTVRVYDPEDVEHGRFVELEAELASGDPEVLLAIRDALAELDLSPSGKSKYERARALLSLPPYEWKAPAPQFDGDTSLEEVARAVCRHQLQLIQNYEPGTRIGLDTEHLHKMRVATRRLRTALRVFADAFSRGDRRAMNRGFRWLGRRLGEVRDLDVAVLALPQWRKRHGPEPADGWDGLAQRLELRRSRARRELIDALDSARWAELAESACSVFASPKQSPQDSKGQSAREVMAQRLDKRREAFAAGVLKFMSTQSLEDAHALRILGKRLRYTIEFFRPALGDAVKPLLRRLGVFQDELGALQDAAEAGAFALRELSGDDDPSTAFVLGALRGAAIVEGEHAKSRIDGALERLDLDELTSALRTAMQSV